MSGTAARARRIRFWLPQGTVGRRVAVLLVLTLFVTYGYWHYRNASGEDLASSYVGSRLLSQGLPQHLFSYDPVSFAEIGEDDTWAVVAQQGHFYGYLHPYVQTPLWAYLLEPLCRNVSFPIFSRIFLLLSLLSFAVAIWLIARYWAPSFLNPYAIGAVVLALALSQPFQYAMFLNQTHMVLLLLTLAALVLAERDAPWIAGLLLAFAAAVKITPGLLVVYWLLTRRWQAALATVVWSCFLWVATILAVGHELTAIYLANLHRISRVLLLSQNNQSFAAWVMQHFYPFDEVFDINILPLPTPIRFLSSALMFACTVWGGWIDRNRDPSRSEFAPLGAMMALVAATVFAPIAWTHYAIVLLMPLMILVDKARRNGRWWMWSLIAVAVMLNYRPLATDIVHGLIGPYAIIRGQFFACILTLVALPLMARLQGRRLQNTSWISARQQEASAA